LRLFAGLPSLIVDVRAEEASVGSIDVVGAADVVVRATSDDAQIGVRLYAEIANAPAEARVGRRNSPLTRVPRHGGRRHVRVAESRGLLAATGRFESSSP
jgi:hypothetical protein